MHNPFDFRNAGNFFSSNPEAQFTRLWSKHGEIITLVISVDQYMDTRTRWQRIWEWVKSRFLPRRRQHDFPLEVLSGEKASECARAAVTARLKEEAANIRFRCPRVGDGAFVHFKVVGIEIAPDAKQVKDS